jgi:hypothetical protein
MSIRRSGSALVAGAVALGVSCLGSAAWAADMPVKAPPPPPASPFVLDVHGFFDVTVANTRVTGSGLYLYPRAAVVQPSLGLALDIYKDPGGFINSFSVFAGVWNESWTSPALPVSGRHWQEMDWWVGASIGFAQHWKFAVQLLEFEILNTFNPVNYTATLSFDDSYLGFPIVFSPYINAFYTDHNGSVVVLGKTSSALRFDAGISPSYSFAKPYGIPLTITAPISVAFGPSDFWNRNDGTTNFCGTTQNLPCALSNVGYYSAGLNAKLALDSYIPKRLGSWYLKAGAQWYHIDNDALLAAQAPVGGIGSSASFATAKRDITVVSGSTGFSF